MTRYELGTYEDIRDNLRVRLMDMRGSSFGPHGEGYVRFALVLPPEKIAQALASIQKSGVLTASSAL